jgi:hypothetical protein
MLKELKRREWLIQVGLSAFIVFHLTAIILGPAPLSYLHEMTKPIFRPYWGMFGLGNTWSFYAPDPAPPIFFEWEWEDQQGQRHTGRYPEFPSNFWNYDRQVFRITTMGYIFMQEGAAERAFVPYLCRTLTEARGISLWRVAYAVPPIGEFTQGTRKYGLDAGLATRSWISHSWCDRERAAGGKK